MSQQTELVFFENTTGSQAWFEIVDASDDCLVILNFSTGFSCTIGDDDPNVTAPSVVFNPFPGQVSRPIFKNLNTKFWVQMGVNDTIVYMRGSGEYYINKV